MMESKKDKIIKLLNRGYKDTEKIADRVGVSKSYVTRIISEGKTSKTVSRATGKAKKFMTAEIGRVDNIKKIAFEKGASVSSLLEKAGITLGQGEEVNDEYGEVVSTTETAKEMDYIIVANYKNA